MGPGHTWTLLPGPPARALHVDSVAGLAPVGLEMV